MPATKSRPFISPPLANAVPTDVDVESPVTHDYGRQDAVRNAWQHLIDHHLIEWARDPSQLDEEGTDTPSKETIQRAISLAGRLCQNGFVPPTRIVPDAQGGIVFEREERNVFESIRISTEGSAEYCVFVDARLVAREPWVLQIVESE